MQHLYVLRRVSSWSFRLSVSVALLLSGAGLATSLLAGATLQATPLPPLAWKPALGFAQTANALPIKQPVTTQVLPVSLSSLVPTSSFAAGPAYSAPLISPAGGIPDTQARGAEADYLSTTSTVKITVLRSWNTFKLAFR